VQLEAGTTLAVFVRLVEKRIERVRVLSDDCPVDAGGRDVRWLTGVSGAESVAYLQSLATSEELDVDVRSGITSAAVRAIGYHRDPAAVSALIAIASAPATSNFVTGIRRQAMTTLGQSRDPRALAYLSSIITR
jgi:HEAT repeat protein